MSPKTGARRARKRITPAQSGEFLQMQSRVLESMIEGVVVSDEDGYILYTNPAEDRMFGYAAGELTGQRVTVLNALAPDGNTQVVDGVIAQLKQTGAWTGEWLNLRKDGTPFSTFSRITAIDAGEKQWWVCVHEDITERKRSAALFEEKEELARKQLAELELIYQNAPVGLVFLDTDLRYVRINERLAAINGVPLADHIGRSIWEVVPAIAAVVVPHYHKVIATRQPILNFEVTGETPSQPGVQRTFLTSYYPVLDGTTVVGVSSVTQEITEQKRSESALRESEKLLRMVIDGVPGLVSYIDRDLRYRFANRRYAEWFNRPNGDFAGTHAAEILGAAQFASIRSYMERALAGEVVVFERGISYRDGEVRRVRASYVPDQAPDGTVNGFIVLVEDNTEIHQSQEAIRRSEERYRALVEASAQHVWTSTGTGHSSRESVAWWTELTGQSFEEREGSGWLPMVHPEDRDRVEAEWKQATETRGVLETEYRLKVRNSTYRDFKTRGVPLWSPDGSFREWVGTLTDITAHKRAEAAVRASEERFRRIVETAAEGIWTVDPAGLTTFANARIASLLDYSVDEMTGRLAIDFVFAEDREHALKVLTRPFAGSPESHEFRLSKKDGTQVWVNASASPLIDERGRALGTLAMFTNITERRKAQEAQKAVDRQLTMLIEASSTLLASPESQDVLKIILDLAKRFVGADAYGLWRKVEGSPNWAMIAREGLSGDFQQTLTPAGGSNRNMPPEPIAVEDVEDAPRFRNRLPAYRAEGIRSLITVPMSMHGDVSGTLVFYYRSPHTIQEVETRVAAALGNLAAAALQTAELYERETRLRQLAQQEERKARFLSESGQVLSSSLDYASTLTAVVELAVPLFADWAAVDIVSPDGELRRVAIKHGNPEKVELSWEFRRRFPPTEDDPHNVALRTGRSILAEDIAPDAIASRITEPERRRFLVEMGLKSAIIVPLMANGRGFGVLSFVTAESGRRFTKADLALAEELARRAATAVDNARLFTESKVSQDALERSNAELKRANEDLNQFAYSASHDLREPIRMVAVYAQLLGRRYRGRLDAEADQYLGYTVEGARRMDSLVRDLLAYTQAVNVAPLPMDAIDANRALKVAVDNLRGVIQESGAEIRYDALPPLEIAETHLIQLFQNLVGNAIKYRSDDRPQIEISSERRDREWVIRVRDNGIGIAPEYSRHIFGIFKRLHGADQYSGTGIGLAICQKLVERYGGRIWVDSEEGKGAMFCFTIPS